jgi:hypothetical protein
LRILAAKNLISIKLEVFTILGNYLLVTFYRAATSIDYIAVLATHLIYHDWVLESCLGTNRPWNRIAVVCIEVSIPTSIWVHALLE